MSPTFTAAAALGVFTSMLDDALRFAMPNFGVVVVDESPGAIDGSSGLHAYQQMPRLVARSAAIEPASAGRIRPRSCRRPLRDFAL
jgi:hypothetical protein